MTSTPMMRSACLIVAQQAQDLALVSMDEGSEAVTVLRRFQADLPVVVIASAETAFVPDVLRRQVQGTYSRAAGDEKARAIVRQLLSATVEPQTPGAPASDTDQLPRPAAIAARLGMELETSGATGLLLSRNGQALAYAGAFTDVQAADLACEVHQEWQVAGNRGALLKFHLLRENAVDVLLYTRSLANGHLLTVIAPAESRLGFLRAQLDRLALHLGVAYGPATANKAGADSTPRLSATEPELPETRCFALAWRPDSELPAVLLQPLRKALDRSARANECLMTHAEVDADFVSIVVQCPAGKEGSWLAQRLKRDTENAIRQRLGVEVTLWEDGHLARETSQPFSRGALATYTQGL